MNTVHTYSKNFKWYQTDKMKVESIHFDGLAELMGYDIDGDEKVPAHNRKQFKRYMKENHESGTRNWYGFNRRSNMDVIRDSMYGSPTILKDVSNKMSDMHGLPKSSFETIKAVKRVKVRDKIGDEIDIHKVFQGNLDTAWSRTQRIETDSKHHLFHIVIDLNAHAKIKASETVWRSVVAVKVADELIRAGKTVKISIIDIYKNHYNNAYDPNLFTTVSVTVKNYNEPLSMERLAAMSNAGFMRVFSFGAVHLAHRDISQTLGQPCYNWFGENNSAFDEEEGQLGHSRVIYVPAVNTQDEALRALRKIYKEN